jgi:putative transposase
MQVYLVFVTKYRLCNRDGQVIEIFSKVCSDFEAELVEIVSQGNHVHLLVNYPPKVSASSLVNSLKGVSSCLLRRQLPRTGRCYWKKALWPSGLDASCGDALLEVFRRYSEKRTPPQ